MKWVLYEDNKIGKLILPICESCLDGKHLCYGDDHTLGEQSRRGCKTVDETGKNQCQCNPDWTELYDSIKNKGLEHIFNSEENAHKYFLKQKIKQAIGGERK